MSYCDLFIHKCLVCGESMPGASPNRKYHDFCYQKMMNHYNRMLSRASRRIRQKAILIAMAEMNEAKLQRTTAAAVNQ